MNKQKILVLLKVSIFIFGFISCETQYVKAFGLYESGSSVIKQNAQIYIDGTQIENPQEKVTIRTNKPIIFGYTVNNVKINLILSQGEVKQSMEESTDASGYWIHPFETSIPAGDYTLSQSLTDNSGVITDSELIATFQVPETLPAKQSIQSIVNIPTVSLRKFNYLTGPMIILAVILILTISYKLIKSIISHE